MNIKACLSHNTDDWKTPKKLYDPIMELNFIDCFPYKAEYDELKNNYIHNKLFINPPFSKLNKICEWLEKQIKNCNEIILLIPSRTDTKYFHKLIKYNPEIFFIKGRLRYNDADNAPFPSLILHFKWFYLLPIYKYGTIEEFLKTLNNG